MYQELLIDKIKKIRKLFVKYEIDGYMISTTDEYLNEFPPECNKRLQYITGFSGSNGLAIILKNVILFFTDGRYLEQAKNELDKDLFQIFDQKLLYLIKDKVNTNFNGFNWQNYIESDMKIAYDPNIFTINRIEHLKQYINLHHLDNNLIDLIWSDRPAYPNSSIYEYKIKYSGEPASDKINRCRKFLAEKNANALLITDSITICWLLNIRAHDIDFMPIMLGCCIITQDNIKLFTNKNRDYIDLGSLESDIKLYDENKLNFVIRKLHGSIIYDKSLLNVKIYDYLNKKQKSKIQNISLDSIFNKICKNKIEIQNMIDVHIDDGIVMCELLSSLSEYSDKVNSSNETEILNEYDIANYVSKLRSKSSRYISDSFPVICGYNENSAIIHYIPKKDTAKNLVDSGLLLIDSGGQYLGGTTDITRVVVIGDKISQDIIYHYNLVLKSHIALAKLKFPEGLSGSNIDVLARQYLWKDGLDYPHGTGHGVGSFLSVHEGPCGISLFNKEELKTGMVLSNEPGCYFSGKYGIRIENMMYIKKISDSNFLEFEQLTLVPYCKALIDISMLTYDEIDFIKCYYDNIRAKIYDKLSCKAQLWFDYETAFV